MKMKEKNFFINDMWHFALFKIVLTAHAYGLRAVDCPFGDFSDELGFDCTEVLIRWGLMEKW